MTDILLHLWRANTEHNASPQFEFSDNASNRPQIEQEFFCPYDGTLGRVIARVHFNDQLGPITIHLLKNGLIQRTIGPIPSMATGLFFPALQLPTLFVKDDLLVFQVLGADFPESFQMELDCDLKFTLPP